MAESNQCLVAGATGYLGAYVARELKNQGYRTKVLVRNSKNFAERRIPADEVIEGEMTSPESIEKCCKGIDTVISCVGITRQNDGLTYMDVDFQANLNLLQEAKKQGVRKFIYVSVLNGEKLRYLKICAAKEKFVDALKESGLEYCVIRPNGFFSDMSDFHKMAKRGKVTLFGNGQFKSNPIHGEDLARKCVEAIEETDKNVELGGPDILTQTDIADYAFISMAKPVIISYLPDWIRRLTLKISRIFLSRAKYGRVEFFMTVMAMDMIAPKYGRHRLKDHFRKLSGTELRAQPAFSARPQEKENMLSPDRPKGVIAIKTNDMPAAA